MSADAVQLIAQLRNEAPFSENGHLYLRAANAIEDAEARVALAGADALNAAANAASVLPSIDDAEDAMGSWDYFQQFPLAWLYARAKAIEVGKI